jgi:putative ABC transport system permease protein
MSRRRRTVLKLSLRDLRSHLGRYVLTFLAVTIGVGFVAGVVTLVDTIARTFDDLYAGLNAGTDVAVRGEGQFDLGAELGGGTQRPRIPAGLVDEIAAAEGVAAAEGYVQGYARPISADGTPYGNPTFGAPTIGTNWGVVDELNPFELIEGRPPEAPDEIVFDKLTADRTGYQVGDVASVQTPGGVTEATLVGVARFGTADSPAGMAVTLFDGETAQALLAEPGQVDTIAAVVDDGAVPTEVRDAVRAALEGSRVDVVTGETLVAESQEAAQGSFRGLLTFLLVFALISVLVGSFVIYTSFAFIVAQQQRQVALLRALGASRTQVLGSVVVEALVVGAVASVVGYGLGVALADLLAGAFLPGSSAVVLPRTLALSLAVGVVVTAASAFFPAARAARVPPVAAMRDVAIDTSHRSPVRLVVGLLLAGGGAGALYAGIVETPVQGQSPLRLSGAGMLALFLATIVLGPVVARPASLGLGRPLRTTRGIVGRLAQQNAARNPKRTASTASALMIGLGIVSLFLVVNASVRASLDHTVDTRVGGDLVIDSGTGFSGIGLPVDVADEIGALPEVDQVTAVRFGYAEIDGTAAFVSGFDHGTALDLFDIDVVAGDLDDLGDDGIGVFRGNAEANGWQVGDEVPIVFGDTGDQPFTVVAVLDSKDVTGSYVLSTDAFDAHLPDAGDTQVWVDLAGGVTAGEGRAALESVVADFPSAEVQDLDEYKASVKAQYDTVLVLVNALLVLTILIAMIGIVNTLVLSVVERTREIGLTRAVGASRGQVRSTIRWEALLIAAFGLTTALTIGASFGWVLVRALADEGFSVFELPTVQLLACAAITGALTLAAAVFPAAWAGRRRILAAIADR